MTLIGVKVQQQRNLYVLLVYAPKGRKRVWMRRESRRPWAGVEPGQVLRIEGRRERLRVTRVRVEVVRNGGTVEHRTHAQTRPLRMRRRRRRPREMPDNVVRMPLGGEAAAVADFLRYHVLIRVYDGDAEAWIRRLQARGDDSDGDLRFARRLRARLLRDSALLGTIRNMVEATPFWRAVV